MAKFKTTYNQSEFPDHGETKTVMGKSLTVPNMALSIQQLIDRQVKSVDEGFGREYDEEDPDDSFYVLPNYKNLDLAQREELLRQAKENVDAIKRRLNEKARLQEIQKQKDALKEQREDWEETLDEDDPRRTPKKPVRKQPAKKSGTSDVKSQGDESTNFS